MPFIFDFYDNYQVVTTPDFDNDLDVDGIDFLTWQRGESPIPLGASDFADWESQFGSTLPAVATEAAAAVIPEPTSVVLLVVGMASFRFRRNGLA